MQLFLIYNWHMELVGIVPVYHNRIQIQGNMLLRIVWEMQSNLVIKYYYLENTSYLNSHIYVVPGGSSGLLTIYCVINTYDLYSESDYVLLRGLTYLLEMIKVTNSIWGSHSGDYEKFCLLG
jgi:hypothetical protein